MIEFNLGDVVRLRKLHPCGGDTWSIVRLGADIGLECSTCHHRVLLERRVLEQRMRGFVSTVAAQGAPTPPEPAG